MKTAEEIKADKDEAAAFSDSFQDDTQEQEVKATVETEVVIEKEDDETGATTETEIEPDDGTDAKDETDASADKDGSVEDSEDELIAGMTKDEFKDLVSKVKSAGGLEKELRSNNSKLYGRIGILEKQLKDVLGRSALSSSAREKLDALDLGDIADALLGGSEDSEKKEPQKEHDANDTGGQLSRYQDDQTKLVLLQKPDFFEIAGRDEQGNFASDEFSKFIRSKSADFERTFSSSYDSTFINKVISEFKEYVSPGNNQETAIAKEAKELADSKATAKKKRLLDAITPRGNGLAVAKKIDDEESGLLEGFNS